MKQPQPNCDQIFRNSDSEVGHMQSLYRANASAIAAERSSNCADRRDDRSQPKRRASGDAEACTAKQAQDNSRAQPYGGGSRGGAGKLSATNSTSAKMVKRTTAK